MPTVLVKGDKRCADLTNKFVAVGVEGGLVPFILFIGVFVMSYKVLGRALSLARLTSPQHEAVLWGLGCAFVGHIMALTSVQYWDQMEVAFYMLLAVVARLCVLRLPERSSSRTPLIGKSNRPSSAGDLRMSRNASIPNLVRGQDDSRNLLSVSQMRT